MVNFNYGTNMAQVQYLCLFEVVIYKLGRGEDAAIWTKWQEKYPNYPTFIPDPNYV